MKKKIKICKYCKAEIPKRAKICPSCHKKLKMGLLPKIVIVIVVLGIIGSCGDSESSQNPRPTKERSTEAETIKETIPTTEAESTTVPETTQEETTTAIESIEETTPETKNTDEWAEVKSLGLDNATMISIYKDYEKALESSPADPSQQETFEKQVADEIAKKYTISADEADLVYTYALLNYEKLTGIDTSKIKLKHGDLLDVKVNGSTIVLKAKISSSFTKNLTVQSCYFDVYDAVQKYKLNAYDELQYWAVADMTDGSEQKVISFTLTQDVLDKISEDQIIKNQLIDYATDAWLSPALK